LDHETGDGVRAWVCGLVLVVLVAAPGHAKEKKRQDEFCHNQYLTRQQQATCVDQVAGVDSMDELKRLQARYRVKIEQAQAAAQKK
jgi:hypothetical protein